MIGVAQPTNSSIRPWILVRPPVTAVAAVLATCCAVVQLPASVVIALVNDADLPWKTLACSPYQPCRADFACDS
ncbi:hypothetical protein KIPE111705_16885 [Kibdelosporangium persicum]